MCGQIFTEKGIIYNMWFSSGPILSYNKTLNFVVGNRGGGKSFEATRLSIATFL